ncbi:hypothetical protein WK34_20910 [Burkholderia vietnamiensis]|nr:hypothetical protein WK34_20910 [Burkholderia vietnamiensis]
MTVLRWVGAQGFVAAHVGSRLFGKLEFRRREVGTRGGRLQPAQHVQNVLPTGASRVQRCLHSKQHGIESVFAHRGEHLRHDAIASRVLQ